MADFRVIEERNGKYRIEQVTAGEGCSTVIGIVVAVVILAFILTNCSFDGGNDSAYTPPIDNSVQSSSSNNYLDNGNSNVENSIVPEQSGDKEENNVDLGIVNLVDLVPDKHGTWHREKNELSEHGPGYSLRVKETVRDAIDDEICYKNALTGGWDWYGEYDWNEYELNGEYKAFTGMLVTGYIANKYPNHFQSPKFVFEADGEIIAEYELSYKDKRVPISFDISGVQKFRIYIFANYVRTGEGAISSQRTGYLVNARIQK